jgi:hypothetical protein
MPSKHFCVKVDQRLEGVAPDDHALPFHDMLAEKRPVIQACWKVKLKKKAAQKKRNLLQIS